MDIIYKKINEVIPYEKNPRKNDEAVKYVAESIKEFGFKVPIIIDKNNVIVAGHTRLKASKKLGYKEVPCIIADDLTPEQIKAFRLADNKVSEMAEWDIDLLNEELEDIIDLNMEDFGFDLNLDFEDKEVEEDDFEVEVPEKPVAKLGDIWQLGEHRLMCGDSTDKETVAKLMDGKKADMVFTDPPYGMKKESDGVLNDNLNFNDLLEFNKKWIPLTFDSLKNNGSWYCWGIDEPLMDIYAFILKPMIKENKITFRNLITWDKGNGQGQLSSEFRMYPIADEKCLFIMCGVQGFNNNKEHYNDIYEGIRLYLEGEAKKVGLTSKLLTEITGVQMYSHWFTKSQFTIITKEHYKKLQEHYKEKGFLMEYDELKNLLGEGNLEFKTLKDAVNGTRAYFDNTHDNQNNVWHFDRTSNQERELTGGHATPKPIALCSRAIKSSSRENEIVLDLFGGSGSTLIACEQLNRVCYINELDPKYVDVIIKRWETLTGKKAVLLNG